MFSDPGYLAATTGLKDPADRKSVVADRNRGIQFKVNPPRNGVLNDAMFDKFKCLSVNGDGKDGKTAYDEGTNADKKAREESRKMMITQNGFRYSSPGKKATGLGGTQGCFSAFKADEVKEGKGKKDDSGKKKDPEPRNILTSPGKRGTYGFPGTTLGKGEEFTYKDADEKTGKKKKEKPEKEPKPIGPAFKAACKSVDFFDGHPNVPASKIYTIEEKFLPKVSKKEPAPKKPLIAAPFKPSSPGKAGVQGTLAKFEYGEKEVEGKKQKQKKQEEEKKPSVVWKPTATAHSLPVKSIAYNSTAINASIIRHG